MSSLFNTWSPYSCLCLTSYIHLRNKIHRSNILIIDHCLTCSNDNWGSTWQMTTALFHTSNNCIALSHSNLTNGLPLKFQLFYTNSLLKLFLKTWKNHMSFSTDFNMAPSVFLVWLTPVSRLCESTLGSLSESRESWEAVSMASMFWNRRLFELFDAVRLWPVLGRLGGGPETDSACQLTNQPPCL